MKHQFFKKSYFPLTIIDLKKLDSNIRNSEAFKIFKSKILKFIRPTASSIFGCRNLIGVKLLTRPRLWLSHIREHKFKYSFQHTFNALCSCGKEVVTTFHFLCSCPNYSDERLSLLSKIRNINPNTLENTNYQIAQFFLYGDKNFTASTNFNITYFNYLCFRYQFLLTQHFQYVYICVCLCVRMCVYI